MKSDGVDATSWVNHIGTPVSAIPLFDDVEQICAEQGPYSDQWQPCSCNKENYFACKS